MTCYFITICPDCREQLDDGDTSDITGVDLPRDEDGRIMCPECERVGIPIEVVPLEQATFEVVPIQDAEDATT